MGTYREMPEIECPIHEIQKELIYLFVNIYKAVFYDLKVLIYILK